VYAIKTVLKSWANRTVRRIRIYMLLDGEKRLIVQIMIV